MKENFENLSDMIRNLPLEYVNISYRLTAKEQELRDGQRFD